MFYSMATAFGSTTGYSFSISQYKIDDIPISDATFNTIQEILNSKTIKISESQNMEFPLCLVLSQSTEKKIYWLDINSYLLFFKSVIRDTVRNTSQNIELKALMNNAERRYIVF